MIHLRDLGYIPYLPYPKQMEFLSYQGREAFYGGAAGGGKSDALLMAAVMYCTEPGYAALLLRRTFAELSKSGAIMERSKSWWTNIARWNGQEKTWTFPSGAKITFGYLDTEDDKYQYLSSEFQFIGFDELTRFTETQYTYLFTRLRRTINSRIPLRMRSASNPGSTGHAWVKKRFIASKNKVFVPAKLEDNPSLDEAEYDASLQEVDPMTRRQMREGDWTDPEGGRFKREWFKFYTVKGTYYLLNGELIPANLIHSRFITVDHASTVKEISKPDPDYTVISTWGTSPKGQLLWLGCVRKRIEQPDIPPLLAHEYQKWNVDKARIESGGTQKGVPQLCRRHKLPDNRFMNIIEVQPKGDKLERSGFAQNMMEAGRVLLPENDPTFPLADVMAEVLAFTGNEKEDAHDDIVDTLSDAAWAVDGQVQRTTTHMPAPTYRSGR